MRLACVKRAASVDSEPGSNSRLNRLGQPRRVITDALDRFDLTTQATDDYFMDLSVTLDRVQPDFQRSARRRIDL